MGAVCAACLLPCAVLLHVCLPPDTPPSSRSNTHMLLFLQPPCIPYVYSLSLSLSLPLTHTHTFSHSAWSAHAQGEVVCLRNALVSKVAETEEALRGATAELEDTNR